MSIGQIRHEIKHELDNILNYWQKYAVDSVNGGFYGLIDADNSPDPHADKGVILNTRILWTFAAAYRFLKRSEYRKLADTAYNYINKHFIDKEFGGVYWLVDNNGKPVNRKKKLYAQAFAIYALSEFYKITQDLSVLHEALEIFHLIELHGHDKKLGGYIEAFDEIWGDTEDLRLGSDDQNERKTMNTHLHILEAYTNLYRVWKSESLKERLTGLINLFTRFIVDGRTYHLNLFFNEKWQIRSSKISFGHDIEASWLLLEAATLLEDNDLKDQIGKISLRITDAASHGVDADGGLMNEFDPLNGYIDKDKHWWPQAEALVGFLNAYELSGNSSYFKLFLQSWNFIKNYIIDHKKGEWFWRVDKNRNPSAEEKAGFWKCPYHNVRACIEVMNRLKRIDAGKWKHTL